MEIGGIEQGRYGRDFEIIYQYDYRRSYEKGGKGEFNSYCDSFERLKGKGVWKTGKCKKVSLTIIF